MPDDTELVWTPDPDPDAAVLDEIQRRVLWLATRMVDHANRAPTGADGIKIGGHQASCASMVTLMTALWFDHLRAEDRVAVKPHASPVLHAINYLLGRLDRRYLTTLRQYGGLQSYPSRTKDPDPVDYSTGSVGLGAICQSWGGFFAGVPFDTKRATRTWQGANQGSLTIAFRIDLFISPEHFKAEMDEYIRGIHKLEPLENFDESLLPGAIEAKRVAVGGQRIEARRDERREGFLVFFVLGLLLGKRLLLRPRLLLCRLVCRTAAEQAADDRSAAE